MFGQSFIDRHMPKREPLDVAFNCAVMTMANLTNPFGWNVEESYVKAPANLVDLNASVNAVGKITVWGGASDRTIFECPEHNAAFRAWHDNVHWKHQLPFNLAGEAACAYVQIWQLIRQYGHDDAIEQWAAIILSEFVGQALMRVQYGEFPLDQREFTEKSMHRWVVLAARICAELSDDDCTEAQAIKLAQATWGRG